MSAVENSSKTPVLENFQSSDDSTFSFPPHYFFPPFFTLQPVITTRRSQLSSWSSLIQSYCRHHRLFTISPVDAAEFPLFNNKVLGRRLGPNDIRTVLQFMTTSEGGGRAEWIADSREGTRIGSDENSTQKSARAWIYWRRPEEWADLLEAWIDSTGQRNTVLTVYELMEGDATTGQAFHSLDPGLMLKSLQILIKKGKAQIFGAEGSQGVKFF